MWSSLISASFALVCVAHAVARADGAKFKRAGYYGRHDPCRQICNEYIDICLPTWLDPWDFFSPHCEDVRDVGRPEVSCLLCLKTHGVTQSANRPTRPMPPPITRPVPTAQPTPPKTSKWPQTTPPIKPPKPALPSQTPQIWPPTGGQPPQTSSTLEIFVPTNPTTQFETSSYWPPSSQWSTAPVGSTPSTGNPSVQTPDMPGLGGLNPGALNPGGLNPGGLNPGGLIPGGQNTGEQGGGLPGQNGQTWPKPGPGVENTPEPYPGIMYPTYPGEVYPTDDLIVWPTEIYPNTEIWPNPWPTDNPLPPVDPSSLVPTPGSATTQSTYIDECPDICTCTRVQTATTEVTTSYCPLTYDADYACDLNDPSAVMTSGDESHCVCEENFACLEALGYDYQSQYHGPPNHLSLP